MISAFGVDHGYEEIEKLSLGGIGGGLGRKVTQLGGGLSRGGAGMRRAAKPGTGTRMSTPGQVNKPMQALGAGMGRAGGQLRKLGQGMQNRPGLTGGLAVGGGATVAGAGVGGLMNRRRF